MITFIRRIFIKNYQDIDSPKVRVAHGICASIFGIVTNVLLFAFKILVGILTFSISIIADAINNLTDFFSCGVNLIGFKVASKPADKDHPYGHERVEYLSGLIISFVIVVVAVLLFQSSIMSLINHENNTAVNIFSFIILGTSILVKIVLGLFYRGMGKAINSLPLKAAMTDSINDAVVSSLVLVAQIIQFYYPSIWYLDASVSLTLSLFVLYSGIKMIRDTISPLIGTAPDLSNIEQIKTSVLKVPGVLGVHDMLVHSYGPTKNYLTLHIEVDGKLNLFDAHNVADEVEESIKQVFKIEATVHIDPVDIDSDDYKKLKMLLNEIIKNINTNLSFHDLRKIEIIDKKRISFDLEVRSGEKIKEEDIDKIRNKVSEIYSEYTIEIKIDENYLG